LLLMHGLHCRRVRRWGFRVRAFLHRIFHLLGYRIAVVWRN